jgi:hypothetical protein
MLTLTIVGISCLSLQLIAEPGYTAQTVYAQAAAAQPPESQNPPAEPAPQESPRDQKEPPTPPHTGVRALFFNLIEDVQHLPSKQNLLLASVGGGLALSVHPADRGTNARLLSHYDGVNKAFAAGKYIGNTPEQIGLSLATFAYGRIFHAPKVSHLGNDLLQAQILTELLVQPIKFGTHRERPDASNARSFPSGHAAVTFATATVLERHLGWRKSLLGYTIASYVAASRLHDNRHYLSDVVFGAAIGSIAGRTVVHHASDYWAFTPVSVPGGGVAVVAMRTFGQ